MRSYTENQRLLNWEELAARNPESYFGWVRNQRLTIRLMVTLYVMFLILAIAFFVVVVYAYANAQPVNVRYSNYPQF